MKTRISILFIILSQAMFGQITYELVLINQCTKEVENDVFWYLTNSDNTFKEANFDSNTITLPKSDLYTLHIIYDNYHTQTSNVHITGNGVIKDTIFLKRIEMEAIGSIPPHSYPLYYDYLECGNPANGEIIDLYENGTLRAKGFFKDGRPIDTLYEYHRNGRLATLLIPRKELKRVSYFDDGKIQSVYNRKKRLKKDYYQGGQLKREEYWSKKYLLKITEYFESGSVSKTAGKKKQKRFNEKGTLIEKITRKKFSSDSRLLKRSLNHRQKLYKYKWQTFDESGIIKRTILFYNDGFLGSHFPSRLNQIAVSLFTEITFYNQGTESKKLEIKYVYETDRFVWKLYVFKKIGEEWIEEKTTTANNVYKIIATHSG
jgi:antitoxin component YwqK of YwqJK toxin-antitoxin module